MSGSNTDVDRRRPGRERPEPDPWRPVDVLAEEERAAGGGTERWLTVFLAGAECPFGCVFCDLWRHTLTGPTPAGALPAQVREARRRPEAAGCTGIKLYNASNLFEPRAVPPQDDAPLAEAVSPFRRVLAECHPRLVGERCLAFAERLRTAGSRLEVALGLETVHPQALPRLGKGMDLDDFDRACATLREAGCGVRAFVLVGAPHVPPEESVEWAVRSVEHALARGAGHVSLIPVRGDTPEMEALAAAGHWTPPCLADLEAALDGALPAAAAHGAVVVADLWDLERLTAGAPCGSRYHGVGGGGVGGGGVGVRGMDVRDAGGGASGGCAPDCVERRRERLERLNRTGRPEPPPTCAG